MDKVVDPRRKEKVNRYKPRQADADSNPQAEDPMPDYMNILGKIFCCCWAYQRSNCLNYFV